MSTVLENIQHKLCSYIFWKVVCNNVWEHPIYSVVNDRESDLLKFAGEFTARVTPVPIPNTEVKPRWADGTARVSVWEIR